MQQLRHLVSYKERIYFYLAVTVSLLIYYGIFRYFIYGQHDAGLDGFWQHGINKHLIKLTGFLSFIIYYAIFLIFTKIFFIGNLIGNGVRITENQFPEIYSVIARQASLLKLLKVPRIYMLNGNGVLNAFATKFFFRKYVVFYSDILNVAYEEGKAAVEFIAGHELGHIKRGHLSLLKTILTLPAFMICPFLAFAYSRAREYTCDRIGCALSEFGAEKGLLILAAGAKLYQHVDPELLSSDFKKSSGFATWFTEIFSSHPHLAKRIAALRATGSL